MLNCLFNQNYHQKLRTKEDSAASHYMGLCTVQCNKFVYQPKFYLIILEFHNILHIFTSIMKYFVANIFNLKDERNEHDFNLQCFVEKLIQSFNLDAFCSIKVCIKWQLVEAGIYLITILKLCIYIFFIIMYFL